jgi:peroxiredoxin Q/BCP
MRLVLSLLAVVGLGVASFAEDAAPGPAVGTPAPAFKLQDQGGAWHTLDAYAGKWLVVYFYPKDGTPGCTKEVCAFRDEISAVRRAGAEVVGVSVDDVASHKGFAEEHKVPFALLADVQKSTAKAYGVLTSRGGYEYARRDTFVIDPQGRIAKHYTDVDPEQNVKQVLQDLAQLKATAANS